MYMLLIMGTACGVGLTIRLLKEWKQWVITGTTKERSTSHATIFLSCNERRTWSEHEQVENTFISLGDNHATHGFLNVPDCIDVDDLGGTGARTAIHHSRCKAGVSDAQSSTKHSLPGITDTGSIIIKISLQTCRENSGIRRRAGLRSTNGFTKRGADEIIERRMGRKGRECG